MVCIQIIQATTDLMIVATDHRPRGAPLLPFPVSREIVELLNIPQWFLFHLVLGQSVKFASRFCSSFLAQDS